MTFLNSQERKALVDLIVHYYDMLHYITLFLQKGANGSLGDVPDEYFIGIEKCMCAIEESIDNIAAYIKNSADAPPSTEAKNKLTDNLQDIYTELNNYRTICEHLALL